MSSDGSTGRRDGFDRWVASVKTDHQPMQAKPAPLKPSVHQKLELDLDENATHVHRIPKEVINRMREQRALEKQSAREQRTPDPGAAELQALEQKALEQRAFGQPDDSEDDEVEAALGGLSDDRTAVFRPPPELLARAKRMKPPSKPNPHSEAPTKPPPAPAAGEWIEPGASVPAAARVPGFESVAAQAKASAPALDAADGARGTHAASSTSQRISSPDVERSAVFTSSEPTSGVVSLGAPEEPLLTPPVGDEFVFEAPALPMISNDALLAASMAAPQAAEPALEASPPSSDEEQPAPTTTSPLVRSEPSESPAPPSAGASRWALWLLVALAALALAFWRRRLGF